MSADDPALAGKVSAPSGPISLQRLRGRANPQLQNSGDAVADYSNLVDQLQRSGPIRVSTRQKISEALENFGEGIQNAVARSGGHVDAATFAAGVGEGLGRGVPMAFGNVAGEFARRRQLAEAEQGLQQSAATQEARNRLAQQQAQTDWLRQRPDLEQQKIEAAAGQRERQAVLSTLRLYKGRQLDPWNPRHAALLERAANVGIEIDPQSWNDSSSNLVPIDVIDPQNPTQKRRQFYNKVTGQVADAGQSGYVAPTGEIDDLAKKYGVSLTDADSTQGTPGSICAPAMPRRGAPGARLAPPPLARPWAAKRARGGRFHGAFPADLLRQVRRFCFRLQPPALRTYFRAMKNSSRGLTAFLSLVLLSASVLAQQPKGTGKASNSEKHASPAAHICAPGQHWVKGYTSRSGRRVRGYCR